ncbi:hypothetical protein Hs30E_04130 [Lactococcus hodotermopsidis]|uniref:Uncharacterized protein n=1 Tax=Pseudolactococcus hodotermopsidis TaxID=2709157 RepID=A0A6A0B931_9LACT|nr:hypothetical protein [Lactococcus hodotermopsidis]GFH41862.1 hypothetical protein Hs30E_04130 [Lactococcus hodotermopsidis]
MWRELNVYILPHQLWLKTELLFNLCVQNPADVRLAKLWQDNIVQKTLKQKQMNYQRVIAAHTFYIEENVDKALEILNQSKMSKNMSNLGELKIELKLADWLLEQINKTIIKE